MRGAAEISGERPLHGGTTSVTVFCLAGHWSSHLYRLGVTFLHFWELGEGFLGETCPHCGPGQGSPFQQLNPHS